MNPGEPLDGGSAVLTIPQPRIRRTVALASIGIFLALFGILPSKLGFERFVGSLTYFSATWLVILIMTPAIVFFARLAFPSQGSLPHLEVSNEYMQVVPGRIARLFGEATIKIPITPLSSEVLFCRYFQQGNADGLRLIVRESDGKERQIRSSSMDYLSAHDVQKLAEGVKEATGLTARILVRAIQADGSVSESPWNPPTRIVSLDRGTAIVSGLIPFVGGSVLGVDRPAPAVIVGVGVALWLCQTGLLFLLTRRKGTRTNFPIGYALSTVFTFGATFAFAVVVVGFLIRGK